MRSMTRSVLGVLCVLLLGCAAASRGPAPAAGIDAATEATLAQVYFWRARPGMLAEYDRYIRDVAEPIDREAQRAGAFVAVTTYAANDTTLPWTHMRVFLLRDSSQLLGLGAALSAAGARLEPDSLRRKRQSEYSATLRDRVGATVTRIVR
jgi:GNAT superfamily N-acetyltransferase